MKNIHSRGGVIQLSHEAAQSHPNESDSASRSVNRSSLKKRRSDRSSASLKRWSSIDWIRTSIWLYVFLWLIEGGLRRWVLPGLATPLLVVRDPLVLAIYFVAFKQGLFPRNVFTIAIFVLAPVSWLAATFAGHHSVVVATYGVRCDFLHVPLIFIIGKVLTVRDLEHLCRIALWVAIPYTILMLWQFYSPQSAFVNRGVGGDMEGAGFSGALGKFRPPGTFSFITGPAQLYPMLAAAWFFLLGRHKLALPLMVLSGVAILLAIPISVSRGLFIAVLIVAFAGTIVLIRSGAVSVKTLLQFFVAGMVTAGVMFAARNQTDAFDAFLARWENSTTNRGGVEEAIVGRVVDGLTKPFIDVPTLGYGTGISTQVGQKVASGTRGFGYSEGEWGRILAEGGLLLGGCILLFRLSIFGSLVTRSANSFLRGRVDSLPFLAAAAPMLVLGQWGQTTSLGSSIIAGGLCLVATKKKRSTESRGDANR